MDSMNPSPEGDASATRRGLVNLVAQIFAGAKTFAGLLTAAASLEVAGTLEVTGETILDGQSYCSNELSAEQIYSFGTIAAAGSLSAVGATISGDALHVTGAYTPGGLTAGAHAWLGSYNGSSAAALWLGVTTPAVANYAVLRYTGGGLILNAPFGEGVYLQNNGNAIANFSALGVLTLGTTILNNGSTTLSKSGAPVFIYAAGTSGLYDTVRLVSSRGDSGLVCISVGTEQASPSTSSVLFQVAKGINGLSTLAGSGTSMFRVLGNGVVEANYLQIPNAQWISMGNTQIVQQDVSGDIGFNYSGGGDKVIINAASGVVTAAGFKLSGTITDTTGTPGSVTINAYKGRAAIDGLGGVTVITNNKVTVNSVVVIMWEGAFPPAYTVVPAAGSFTIQTDGGGYPDYEFRFAVL